MLHKNLEINKAGHLTFAGVDTCDLAKKYGTPLMLLDEAGIRENCRIYKAAAKKHFGENARVLYASKALSFVGIYKIMQSEHMCIDVVSPGEIFTAAAAGFNLENSYFHGNNKPDQDIKFAMEKGVGYFVADNREELERINSFAGARGIRQKILLRLTPGIDPHTHSAVATGKVDSKFGAAIETGQAEELIKFTLTLPNIELRGYHCHIGSQIFSITPYLDAADIMIKFIAHIKAQTNYEAPELNIGGGLGVQYIESHPKINYEKNIAAIAKHIKQKCKEHGVKLPVILMEPGRSIVAANGITLYTVGSLKEIKGYKNYVAIDGGMTDNPRYALYQSPYTIILANRANEKATAGYTATIAGRACESGDIIQENVALPKPKRGDILAVLVTGAYNYAMASNYNRIPRPPIIAIDEKGNDRIAVSRESFEDLIKLDMK